MYVSVDDWKRSFHTAERDVNLEPSDRLTPSEALNMHRSRATVEHPIHSLKRVTSLKTLRAWKENSIRGAMLLALLAETAIAMAGYGMETRKGTKGGRAGDTDGNAIISPNPWYGRWVIRQLPVRSRMGGSRRPIPAIGIRYPRRSSPISLWMSVGRSGSRLNPPSIPCLGGGFPRRFDSVIYRYDQLANIQILESQGSTGEVRLQN